MRLARLRALGIEGDRAREFAVFGGSTAIYQGGRFAYSLAAAAVLDLPSFALWALVVAALTYAPALSLGVTNGMARELPFLVGAGRPEAAAEVESAGWWAAAGAMLALLASGWVASLVTTTPASAAALPIVAGLAAAVGVHAGQLVLRSRLAFGRAAIQQGAIGLAMVAAAAALLAFETAELVLVAGLHAAALGAGLLLGIALHPPRLARPRAALLGRLAGIGFPIMIAGVAFSFLITSDRWAATAVLGAERAAPYALASLIASAMLMVPTVVSQQTYPRMAIAHGRGADAAALLHMARRQGLVAAALVAPVSVGVAVAAFVAVPRLLPAYASGVPAAIVLCAAFVALAAFTGYGNFLNVTGRQWAYLGAQLAAIAVALPLMVLGALAVGPTGVAAGIGLAFLAYGALLRTVARRSAARG